MTAPAPETATPERQKAATDLQPVGVGGFRSTILHRLVARGIHVIKQPELSEAVLRRAGRIHDESTDPSKREIIARFAVEFLTMSASEQLPAWQTDFLLDCIERFAPQHFTLLQFLDAPREFLLRGGAGDPLSQFEFSALCMPKPFPAFIAAALPKLDTSTGFLKVAVANLVAAGVASNVEAPATQSTRELLGARTTEIGKLLVSLACRELPELPEPPPPPRGHSNPYWSDEAVAGRAEAARSAAEIRRKAEDSRQSAGAK